MDEENICTFTAQYPTTKKNYIYIKKKRLRTLWKMEKCWSPKCFPFSKMFLFFRNRILLDLLEASLNYTDCH